MKTKYAIRLLLLIGAFSNTYAHEKGVVDNGLLAAHCLNRAHFNLTKTVNYDSVFDYTDRGLALLYKKENSSMAKLLRYKALAFSRTLQYDSAFYYFHRAIEVNQKLKDTYYEAKNWISIGAVYYNKEENHKAIENYLKAYHIAVSANDFKSATAAQNNIGASYKFMGQYLKASEHLLVALEIARENNLTHDEAKSLGNLANCYGKIGNHKLSKAYYFEEKKIKENLKDTIGLINTYINLGFHYSSQNAKDSALFYYQQGLQLAKLKGTMLQKSVLLSNISTNYHYHKQFETAIAYLHQAYQINKAINRQQGLINCNINLADNYIELQQYSLAKNHLDEALVLAEKNNLPQKFLQVYNIFSSYFAAIKDFKQAYQYKQMAYQLSDTIMNAEIATKMQELQVKYDIQQKENRILELEHQTELALLESQKQRRNLFIIAILFLSLVGILLMYNRQKRLTTKNREATLSQKLLRSQMNPHFIFNALGSIQNFIFGNNSQKAANYLSNFARLMRDILEASNNEFISLEQEVSIVKNYLKLQKMRKNDLFNFSISHPQNTDEYKIPPMIAQPFIENAAIHAFKNIDYPGNIKVTYTINEPYFNIIVEDNGIGYNPEQQKNQKHKSMAMNLTHQRLELLKDKKVKPKIDILNKNKQGEKGTKIVVAIPLEICLKF